MLSLTSDDHQLVIDSALGFDNALTWKYNQYVKTHFCRRFRRQKIARFRAEAIARYRAEHPDLTLEDVGDVFSTSRQRVHQIVQGKEKEQEGKVSR